MAAEAKVERCELAASATLVLCGIVLERTFEQFHRAIVIARFKGCIGELHASVESGRRGCAAAPEFLRCCWPNSLLPEGDDFLLGLAALLAAFDAARTFAFGMTS